MQLKYKKIDAFTSGNSKGNPAACLLLGDKKLTPAQMLDFGKEHAGFVSEVVFVENSAIADCKLTYYSSECEVDFCGHGTIATMYELIKSTPNLLSKHEITVETNRKGLLTVYNNIADQDAVYITSPEGIRHEMTCTPDMIAQKLGISHSVYDNSLPFAHIEAGLRTIIVPIKKLADEISIWPNEQELKEFAIANNFDNVLIFSIETSNPNCIAHTRVFAPRFGYLEDPATGSSNSAFAYYLLDQQLWNGNAATIEQGGNNRVFNNVRIMHHNNRILFGGGATLKIEGIYNLND